MMVIQQKSISAHEFEAFLERPENVDRLFELINGEIVEKVPSNPFASEIAQLIAFFIRLFLRENNLEGHVTGEAGGFKVAGDQYAPDVAYVSKERQAILSRKGYNVIPPELAVEVEMNTTNASERRLRAKILRYLDAGVLVWVVYPEMKEIEVYEGGKPMRKLTLEDTLDGSAVLPGFTLPLKDIFVE